MGFSRADSSWYERLGTQRSVLSIFELLTARWKGPSQRKRANPWERLATWRVATGDATCDSEGFAAIEEINPDDLRAIETAAAEIAAAEAAAKEAAEEAATRIAAVAA